MPETSFHLPAGATILLVEQNVLRALAISQRAYVLETDRIVLDGPSSELLTRQATLDAYLDRFLCRSG